ncbi:MAG: hypothetical protein LBB61_02490 [Treponema sp.]|jgi:hypothetical protein|nr:hypothetical protein [Treponema sp.]
MTAGGTPVIRRAKNMLPVCKYYLKAVGFQNAVLTSEEIDSLNFVINEQKLRLVFIERCFYEAVTPYMIGRLLRDFPKLRLVAFSIGEFPDDLTMWFYFHGVKIISTSGMGCANLSGAYGRFYGQGNSTSRRYSGVLTAVRNSESCLQFYQTANRGFDTGLQRLYL